MKYKTLFYFHILIAACSTANAQTARKAAAIKRMTDSLTMEGLSAFAMRYPQLRQAYFATDFIGKADVKAELNGKDLYEGKMNMTRIRSNFNVPISNWGKNVVTGTIGYQQQHFKTTEIKSYDPRFSTADLSETKSTVSLSASFGRSDSIFNKLIFYGLGISGVTDELSSIKRLNYIGSISVPIKRNETSALTIGLVVIIDPSAIIPAVPIVSYWHKYKASNVELFIDFPSRVVLRKQFTKKTWATVGSELGGSLLFFNLDQPSLPRNSIYTNAEVRTGLTFEYLVTKKLILGMSGGLFTTTPSRMFDRNDKPDDYFFKAKNGSAPYLTFSVSFLPFLKKL
ncbi:DUF6268 family outer membrane beta-barrel protein [Pedobacter cryoconitis]|uniref:DUF6268 domain-containing protein n=1 Tax=Pedobacter cryoconitis TaxID=188932 RepID=A0A327SUV5_9SPHI|nr:DUF6268 family outer membrane beta-barrel protein [Pedobacter cryoconitis]RAJ33090.1 hypothetical protein LY11_01780 [Pedobacter cryoconitis]